MYLRYDRYKPRSISYSVVMVLIKTQIHRRLAIPILIASKLF